jgi:acyl-CoA thioester hydrolase
VADVQLRYHASARYDDLVRIVTRLTGVRSRMVTFAYELFRVKADGSDGERLATASTTLVSIDRDGKPASLPAEMRRLLDSALPRDIVTER